MWRKERFQYFKFSNQDFEDIFNVTRAYLKEAFHFTFKIQLPYGQQTNPYLYNADNRKLSDYLNEVNCTLEIFPSTDKDTFFDFNIKQHFNCGEIKKVKETRCRFAKVLIVNSAIEDLIIPQIEFNNSVPIDREIVARIGFFIYHQYVRNWLMRKFPHIKKYDDKNLEVIYIHQLDNF